MNDKTFIDSNVLIYAHDLDAGAKHQKAADLLESLWNENRGVLSTQVLQEFYVNVTRKIARPLPRRTAREIVDAYGTWSVDITPAELKAAFHIEDDARISFWDALIVAGALKAGAHRILSEDLNARQLISGIRIENPFVPA
ncbi:MAG: PIN domain-containing protein [Acidobacteriaceae bacterium]